MRPFDEAVIDEANGAKTRLTYEDFFKLPLVRRVNMLRELKVRFFKAGRPVSAVEALR